MTTTTATPRPIPSSREIEQLRAEVERKQREIDELRELLRQSQAQAAQLRGQLGDAAGLAEARQAELNQKAREMQQLAERLNSVNRGAAASPATGRQDAGATPDDERRALIARQQQLEAELARIEAMRWHERIYDTARRIAKNALRPVLRLRAGTTLPTMTIVTPVYNGEKHIRETIESVLSQNYPGLEYIVVDGGSTDGTMAIVREYGTRISHVISELDGGMYDAIGKGFQLATGDVLGYLNSDDLYEPGGLLRVGEFFRDHPLASVAYHEDTVLAKGWRFANAPQPRVDMHHILRGHILFQDGVFFKRSAYLAVGGVSRRLKLAGDWELWVRLARKFQFYRADGHVSTFRVHEKQLSRDMAAYNLDLERARNEFLKTIGPIGSLRRLPRHWLNRLLNGLSKKFHCRKFFYPIDFAAVPFPPGEEAPYIPGRPVCPLTGQHPNRVLFSARDTRFGHKLISTLYYCDESGVAITFPPLSKEELNKLYETHYSTPGAAVQVPIPGYGSPYARYDGRRFHDKVLGRLDAPRFLSRGVTWDDTTSVEVRQLMRGLLRTGGTPAVGSAGVPPATVAPVRFLDVGCFEGHLLDGLAKVGPASVPAGRDAGPTPAGTEAGPTTTGWQTFGLEPNARAVEVARGKGHQVWQAYAEDAPFAVPAGMLFDVVFLGQTIEHVLDPVAVVRRLSTLLEPDGLLIMSTPNLDSKQIDLYGPTWAHWHLPYHRHLFCKRSLELLARQTDMKLVHSRTYSHPYWTGLSMQLNRLGLGGAVPHGVPIPPEFQVRALRLCAWSKLYWDRLGRGDYIYVVMKRDL